MFKMRAGIVGKDKTLSVFSDMPVTLDNRWFNLDPGVYVCKTLLDERLLIVVKEKMPS